MDSATFLSRFPQSLPDPCPVASLGGAGCRPWPCRANQGSFEGFAPLQGLLGPSRMSRPGDHQSHRQPQTAALRLPYCMGKYGLWANTSSHVTEFGSACPCLKQSDRLSALQSALFFQRNTVHLCGAGTPRIGHGQLVCAPAALLPSRQTDRCRHISILSPVTLRSTGLLGKLVSWPINSTCNRGAINPTPFPLSIASATPTCFWRAWQAC